MFDPNNAEIRKLLSSNQKVLTRVCNEEEFQILNAGKEAVVGDTYKMRRSHGEIDQGWQFVAFYNDSLLFFKVEQAA